mmetsp:Transcript_29094/g.55908  ORF Transcript_29094/g.55908 Transcript_29094/m.55908 type:complete len:208 (-) Transcript_29094:650-1273(-)
MLGVFRTGGAFNRLQQLRHELALFPEQSVGLARANSPSELAVETRGCSVPLVAGVYVRSQRCARGLYSSRARFAVSSLLLTTIQTLRYGTLYRMYPTSPLKIVPKKNRNRVHLSNYCVRHRGTLPCSDTPSHVGHAQPKVSQFNRLHLAQGALHILFDKRQGFCAVQVEQPLEIEGSKPRIHGIWIPFQTRCQLYVSGMKLRHHVTV